MDYQLYEHSDILLNENSENSKKCWNLSTECSMDNNSDLFGWNTLKIDEQDKISRKRRLSEELDQSKNKQVPKETQDSNRKLILKKNNNARDTVKMQQWQVEDYGDLNSDIDNSLSLGNDLINGAYSENILTMNGLTVFKQEAPSPTSSDVSNLQAARKNMQSSSTSNHLNVNSTIDDHMSQTMFSNTINQLLNQGNLAGFQNVVENTNLSSSNSQDSYNITSTKFNPIEDKRFQYVLAAATSIATKQNEDTLTYLNQGQSYEIKLKKLGDLSYYRGKILKTYIRVCFHERRLQYMEKEQMQLWQTSRPGDRILEVDIPLSYGAFDITQPANAVNVIHFNWDPTKEVGVYIKVNCISTEFTAKKHGGEKGVPFRIQVETCQNSDVTSFSGQKRLHVAACQVKVFKLKGADRKHKQDREKIMKRSISEQEKYQPSYDCTVLSDIIDATSPSPPSSPVSTDASTECTPQIGNHFKIAKADTSTDINQKPAPILPLESQEDSHSNNNFQLSQYSTPEDTIRWLTLNRFEKYLETFERFSGDDMLRMSREDLIQICGSADGIRLHNAIHLKTILPKLKLYICKENSPVFNAIYLSSHSSKELIEKLVVLLGVPRKQVCDVYMEGPQSIHVQLNDDVLKHIKEEAMFSIKIMQQENNVGYVLLLKRTFK
ncbi:transcription factor CP2-like protein 1 [Diorhabda carinulata]|uniref:transcription factor CP2-like protein 1 n=1 Tax=Diorhabda carinulata TaxID=1163345 RepID=UPI0025A0818E|nr:transcription factor CP2-like protein 1 [Diorhabda carinulata]XP_057653358.1 transcription factor CP2-like protein 1 [Diorhabda carinulata]